MSSPDTTTYPPPPRRQAQQGQADSTDRTEPASSLYAQSPHHATDARWQRRRARANCGLDPLHVVGLIVLAGLLLNAYPHLLYLSTYTRIFSSPPKHRPLDVPSPPLQESACNCSPRNMVWQKTFTLPSASKGCHLVTPSVEREIADGIRNVKAGLITLFIQHTSAALSINENYDSTVRTDMNMAMDRIVPESLPWKHTDEGPDDSASHTKASLFGSTITIPITDGRLNLGTWQGIYLCEFRAMKHSRKVVATVLP